MMAKWCFNRNISNLFVTLSFKVKNAWKYRWKNTGNHRRPNQVMPILLSNKVNSQYIILIKYAMCDPGINPVCCTLLWFCDTPRNFLLFFFWFLLPGVKFKVLCLPGRYWTTVPYPQPSPRSWNRVWDAWAEIENNWANKNKFKL